MKITIIYNPNDNKLKPSSYSLTYQQMLKALRTQFQSSTDVEVYDEIISNEDLDVQSIDADAIIFYDVHSSQHIRTKGLSKHPAIKYEYFDDPHQMTVCGRYRDGTQVYKLGAEERCRRAIDRGVQFIICPYYDAYFRFLAPYLDGLAEQMLIHFPISPDPSIYQCRDRLLVDRWPGVLANGATECPYISLYDFRKWAFCRPSVTFVDHYLKNQSAIKGPEYPSQLLAKFAGGLALADMAAVPKYFEMPLAGCVTFMQWNSDAYRAGFRDYQNCIFVEKSNFDKRVNDFISCPEDYQSIADKGRQLVEHNYTAQHFAKHIYNHIHRQVNATN